MRSYHCLIWDSEESSMMLAHSRVDRNRNDNPLWCTMAPHSPRKFPFAGQRDAVAKLSTPRSPAFFSLTQPLAALLYSCPSPLIIVALSLSRAPQNFLAQPLSRLACPSLAQSLSLAQFLAPGLPSPSSTALSYA